MLTVDRNGLIYKLAETSRHSDEITGFCDISHSSTGGQQDHPRVQGPEKVRLGKEAVRDKKFHTCSRM